MQASPTPRPGTLRRACYTSAAARVKKCATTPKRPLTVAERSSLDEEVEGYVARKGSIERVLRSSHAKSEQKIVGSPIRAKQRQDISVVLPTDQELDDRALARLVQARLYTNRNRLREDEKLAYRGGCFEKLAAVSRSFNAESAASLRREKEAKKRPKDLEIDWDDEAEEAFRSCKTEMRRRLPGVFSSVLNLLRYGTTNI